MTDAAITAFVTLFVIIDPIGLMPMFVAITQGTPARQRRFIALRAVALALGLLALFGFAGDVILNFIGISMPAFRISGGILLFLTAVEMLFERRRTRREQQTDEAEADHNADPSVFPLAMPLIAGPGAMTSMILLMDGARGFAAQAVIMGALITVLIMVLALFLASGLLERLLGQTGINVITRLLGMVLAALSIQFILDGIRDFGII